MPFANASRPSAHRSPSIVLSWRARAALWRALTKEANVAFEQCHDVRARVLYEAALAEADALFAAATEHLSEDAIELAPTAYNLSCHNVAELARRQRDHATEGIFLHRAYERLVLCLRRTNRQEHATKDRARAARSSADKKVVLRLEYPERRDRIRPHAAPLGRIRVRSLPLRRNTSVERWLPVVPERYERQLFRLRVPGRMRLGY